MGTKPDLAATETEIKGILRQKTIQNQLVTPEGYTRSVENEIFTFSQKKKKKQIPGSQDEHIFPYGKIVWCSQHLRARERGGGREGNQSGKA